MKIGRKKNSPSLKNRLLLYFMIVAILPVLVIAGITLKKLKAELEQGVIHKNEILAKQLSEYMERYLNEPVTLLHHLDDVLYGKRLIEPTDVNAYLLSLVKTYRMFDMIKVLDQNGIITYLAPFDQNIRGLDFSHKPYFREAVEKNKVCWSNTFISPQTGSAALILCVPLKTGVAIGNINLSGLNTIVDRVKSGRSGYATLTDNYGVIIAHPSREKVAERRNARYLPPIRKGLSGSTGTFFYQDDQEERIGSVSIIDPVGWLAVFIQPAKEAFQPITKLMRIIYSGMLFGVLASVVFALISLRQILKPLGKIADDANRIRSGKLVFQGNPPSFMEIDALGGSIKTMIGEIRSREESLFHEIAERKQSEQVLAQNEAKQRAMIANISDVIAIIDADGINRYKSPNVEKWFGWKPEELVGESTWLNIHPEDLDDTQHIFTALLREPESPVTAESRYRCKDGSYKWIEFTAVNLMDNTSIRGILLNYHDISMRKASENENRKLQEQLTQAQKMESIGRLAGGVAHDFNNMLSVILGRSELAMLDLDPSHSAHKELKEICIAAERSSALTRQLLAFARRQTVAPKVIDLNAAVEETLAMLKRLIGEDVNLVWTPGRDLWRIKMDPSQISQALANLAVNSRDAISGSGTIWITTGNLTLTGEEEMGVEDLLPGEYVMLSVRDDGTGMDPVVKTKIFEPFFTTKDLGKGTGLGLATVYGTIRQNNGYVSVWSAPDKGTEFRLFLPRFQGRVPEAAAIGESKELQSGTETILLVEDEPSLLDLSMSFLKKLGYKVLPAETPETALAIARRHAGKIDLLMTDIIMPGMNGRELANRLHGEWPDLKCLYMSGYTADVIAQSGVLEEGLQFIEKPFTQMALSVKVRQVLGHDT